MNKVSLPLLLLLFGCSAATLTYDNSTEHGHSKAYFDSLKNSGGRPGRMKNYDHYYIHLIPHTHDDVGWLKNPDEYFYGINENIQYADVSNIISNVVSELLLDANKKFSYVEMKFFSMWWEEQSEETKNNVRKLVKLGQLEFLNAGWSMNDEACPHYEDILNNMQIGHDFLRKEFDGYTPRIGWHIDPFGHSNANPRLFAEMGFDAWFFARLDYQDKTKRLDELSMEYVWKPFYDHLGNRTQIFTHVLYNHYSAPSGLGFDMSNDNNPFIDDPEMETYNADDLASKYYDWMTHQAQHYKSNHLFVTMGDDFNYMNAKYYFKSMDKLIKFFNNKYTDMTMLYSTPSNYIDSIKDLGITWPTKYDDMFPYADDDTNFWTGYFTSRVIGKDMIRRGEHSLMASTQLYAQQALNQASTQDQITSMKTAQYKMLDVMGVNQHHDAVTGTGKQAVASHYEMLVFNQMQENNQEYAKLIAKKAEQIVGAKADQEWTWCFRDNGTYLECPISNYKGHLKNILLAIHNPAQTSVEIQRVKGPFGSYKVYGYDENSKSFINAKTSILCDKDNLENGQALENCNIYAKYSIPAGEIGYLAIKYTELETLEEESPLSSVKEIENKFQTLTFVGSCPGVGEVFELKKKQYTDTFKFSFDIRYWPSSQDDGQNSGVYIFKTTNQVFESIKYTNLTSMTVRQGSVASEIHMKYHSNETGAEANVFVRLFEDSPLMEWEVTLGSIPDTGHGQEVTINFRSFDIDNNNTFYTDSNGLEMQERILNYRPTWNWTGTQNISGNYYPIQTAISIKDTEKNTQMTVMNPRSQGASVLKKGRIEIMQNRRLYRDDSRGMGEPLNEVDDLGNGIITPATYYLQICNLHKEESLQRKVQLRQDDPTQTFFLFQEANATFRDSNTEVEGLQSTKVSKTNQFLNELSKKADPTDVVKYHIFPVAKNEVLLRIENIGDNFDLKKFQKKTQLKLNLKDFCQAIFEDANAAEVELNYIDIQEVSLTNNQLYSDMMSKKIQWLTEPDSRVSEVWPVLTGKYEISLEKQRIRTFRVSYIVSEMSSFLQ